MIHWRVVWIDESVVPKVMNVLNERLDRVSFAGAWRGLFGGAPSLALVSDKGRA
jgi:hypothetical protein